MLEPKRSFASLLLCGCLFFSSSQRGPDSFQKTLLKPRLLITTDIGGDPDDIQSMIRLLVTSSEFELEGLVASATGTPGELDTSMVRDELIRDLVERYDSVYPNLILHHPDFPSPGYLRSIIKKGNPERGIGQIGPGFDTEGSSWIRERILHPDPRPLNISIWGGQTDVFQALISLKTDLSQKDFRHTISGIRVYNIGDQDRIHAAFRDSFPDLFHVLAKAPPGRDKREGAFRGMYLGGDESFTSASWVHQNVKEHHGPLGAAYPVETWTAPNPHGCMKEGDTPSWFYFFQNGLQDPWHPEYGGWGGRFVNEQSTYYVDATDQVDSVNNARSTVWRWREHYQGDFQARMDWCVSAFKAANHPPVITLTSSIPSGYLAPGLPLRVELRGKEELVLNAEKSWDPDGDSLEYLWWIYPEPSDMEVKGNLFPAEGSRIELQTTELNGSGELHLILQVRDLGVPSLVAYQRLILNL